MVKQVRIDVDAVLQQIQKLLRELNEFPDPSDVRRTNGPNNDAVARVFKDPLDAAAETVSDQVRAARDELLRLDKAVRAAIRDLTAEDDEAQVTLERAERILDDARGDAAADAKKSGGQPKYNQTHSSTVDTRGVRGGDTDTSQVRAVRGGKA